MHVCLTRELAHVLVLVVSFSLEIIKLALLQQKLGKIPNKLMLEQKQWSNPCNPPCTMALVVVYGLCVCMQNEFCVKVAVVCKVLHIFEHAW